jgi:DNA-binding MarR family transcriptional regulator
MTPEIITLFSTPETRKVFETVVKQITIRFKDLVDSLEIDEATVVESLDRLEKAKLIDESPAPLRDFKTLYITADGLSANRELRRIKLSDRADSASQSQ